MGAVVDVALETAPLLVLSSDQPLARGAQVLDEPNVPEHEARLRRQVLHQTRLGGGDRIAGRERHGDRPEQLALVPDREAVLALERRELVAGHRQRARGRRVGRPGGDGP